MLLAAGVLAACGGGGTGSGGDGAPSVSSSSQGSSTSSTTSSSGAASSSSSSTPVVPEVCTPPASSSSSSSSSSSTVAAKPLACPADAWFCDDFQSGTADKWDLTPGTGASFAVVDEPGSDGNKVLQYTAGTTSNNLIALLKDSQWAGVSNKADYYVEARIKPQINGTTGNKQIYLLGRYQDANNWYFGGLNVQNASASTQVEAGYRKAGTITRTVQGKKPIIMGTQGQNDGQWYTVRYEMIGGSQVVYLDGEKIGTVSDTAFASGKIGLWTANKSFLIDDIRVGDPAVKPVALVLSPSTLTYTPEAGDPAYVVSVTALKNDGVTADTFTVASSDSSVVSVSVSAGTVTLTPLKAGSARITFTSGSDSSVTRVITATVAEGFTHSSTVYNLAGKVSPAVGEAAAYVDGKLTLTFDAAPVLGTNGSIRIFKTSDDSLVDTIKIAGDVEAIGAGFSTYSRGVSRKGAWVEGNKLVIAPHQANLAYGTSYYVGVAKDAVSGTLAGTTFDGIGKAAGWSFTTKAAPATTLTTLTVDDDGVADFRSVQGALNYLMKNTAADTAKTINVKDGTYQEMLFIRGQNNLTIKGESRTGTIIQYANAEALNGGSGASASGISTSNGGRAVILVEDSDLLTFDTLTLKNTWLRAPASSQAEVIYFNTTTGNHRLIAKNAEFHSEQDTIQVKGYSWFYNTLISGNVDFIWGNNRVALFENSEIRSVGDTMCSSVGYVLQARTLNATDKGFVFLNSRLTSGRGPGGAPAPTGVYLARSGGSSSYFDNIAFINTTMGDHVLPEGWAYNLAGQPVSNPGTSTAASGWREYNSRTVAGAAVDVTKRVGGYQLSTTEAQDFLSRDKIFAAFNSGAGWNPQP
ncbi:pectinesterase family protein [Uliginosibacterium paludis]|uniref:Pectinesterase family protein n=1 Tax=Uliginosibacterium paludis TaxID=1615952 RepID=A0ABV2CU37_9RHOO